MGFVEFQQVSKHYGALAAVNNVDLAIRQGEFFSILGPSGCGKTTMLRLIAGFIQPDRGAIRIAGEQVEGIPPEKRKVGMVFQNYALFPHLTVVDNIAFGLSIRRESQESIRKQVREMLDLVQLNEMADRFPRQLSGGQQQRVALARALITKPHVLLLDEPLAALDKQLRSYMQVELRDLQRKLGITTFFVTHDQEEAMTLADRIAVMKEGQIIQIGPPGEVYERPRTRFVSNFLGSSNFFSGEMLNCVDGRADVRVREDLILSAECGGDIPAGKRVLLVVRPEKIRLFAEKPALPNCIPARVAHLVYMGTSTTYLLSPDFEGEPSKSGEPERITVFDQNERSRPDFTLEQRVYAAWSADSCFLLED
jgi:spermidine/putrescine ABC transporter ATP-binding subunit